MNLKRMKPVLNSLFSILPILLCNPAHADIPSVGGKASIGGKDCTTTFLVDTGAEDSYISRDCATALGLLDKDGKPVGNNGEIEINKDKNGVPQEKAWCYQNVTLSGTDSNGKVCSAVQNVYVSEKAGDSADNNILGGPWQDKVDLCYRAKGKVLTWPWEQPAPNTPSKDLKKKADSQSGSIHNALEGVKLAGASGNASVDMVLLGGSNYSILPQSVAARLGTITGAFDLASADPQLWKRLQIDSLDSTLQSVFGTVTVNSFDIGFGTVNSPMTFLVSDDANSDFGIMGDGLLQSPDGDILYADPGGAPRVCNTATPEPGSFLTVLIGVVSSGMLLRQRRKQLR